MHGEKKTMEGDTFKPVRALRSYWLTHWLLWLLAGLLLGTTPYLLQTVFGLPIQGALPSLVTVAALLLLMIPIGIWLPAYYLSIEYRIEPDSVRSRRGVFWKRLTTVPFHKITNIDITQGPLQRAFGIGTVHVQTAGAGGSQAGQAELLLQGIEGLEDLRDRLLARSIETGGSTTAERTADAADTGSMLEELRGIRRLLEQHRK